MKSHAKPCRPSGWLRCLTLVLTLPVQAALTIDIAVQLALKNDPLVQASRAQARALQDKAVADGQLPDPKLRTGLYNLPLDTLDLDQEPVTQLRLGLMQAFPRGKTLQYKQQRGENLAQSEQAKADLTQLRLQRDVRKTYLQLYEQLQSKRLVAKTRQSFEQLLDVTEAHYASGRGNQQDVLGAKLELSRLDDRITRIQTAIERERAGLAKWLGDAAEQVIDDSLPQLPAVSNYTELQARLPQHPMIQIENGKLAASKSQIDIAREQFKPGWSAGLEYRKRFGDNPDGSHRTDMLAAMLTVDLPLWNRQRHDRNLSASISQSEANVLMRDDKLRELQGKLDADYAEWQRLGERTEGYTTQLLPESHANHLAALQAYQNNTGDYSSLIRAYTTELNIQLEALRVRVERAQAQVRLLYLSGETS